MGKYASTYPRALPSWVGTWVEFGSLVDTGDSSEYSLRFGDTGDGIGEKSLSLDGSVLVGDGAPQPKKLLSLEEPAGDFGGGVGSGLLRLAWLA